MHMIVCPHYTVVTFSNSVQIVLSVLTEISFNLAKTNSTLLDNKNYTEMQKMEKEKEPVAS